MGLALEREGKTDLQIETVNKRLKNNDGTPIGVSNKNPISMKTLSRHINSKVNT